MSESKDMQLLVSCDCLKSLLATPMNIRLKLNFLRITDFYVLSRSGEKNISDTDNELHPCVSSLQIITTDHV